MKFRVIDALRRRIGARTFIAAGTYLGVTAARAAAVFDAVYTIELSPSLAALATRVLAYKPNVRVVLGDVQEVIPKLLGEQAVRDVIVFLDSHPCGPQTALGMLPEPAVEELPLLAPNVSQVKAIIADDSRLFGVEPGYPTKGKLLATAEESYGALGFEVRVELDQLLVVAPA
jgi:hypothetical protein